MISSASTGQIKESPRPKGCVLSTSTMTATATSAQEAGWSWLALEGVQTNSYCLRCCTLLLQLLGGRCAGSRTYMAIGWGCHRPSQEESVRSSCSLPTSYNSTIPSFPLGVGVRSATLHTSYPLSTKYTCTDTTTHLQRLPLLFASSFRLQQPSSWNQTAVATF